MTDEEFIFHQEIQEKKAAGRGAYHKKCGSKSKKVTFPSDYLTNAEKKRRNGEVKTYNINKVINNYTDFKNLPDDLKLTYLLSCKEKFGAMGPDIAKSMNVIHNTLTEYLHRKHIRIGKGGRPKLSPDWNRFIKGEIDINGKELNKEQAEDTVKVNAIDLDAAQEATEYAKNCQYAEIERPIKITDDDIPLGASIGAIIEALKGSGAKLTIELTL